jgi:hypothetical protein
MIGNGFNLLFLLLNMTASPLQGLAVINTTVTASNLA